MPTHSPLVGLVPAVFTPLTAQGELNLTVIESYAEFLVRDGVSGVFVGGTTGEFTSLTLDERLALAARWAAVVKGTSLRMVAHVGAHCLADAKRLATEAQNWGVAAIAALAPTYLKPKSLEALILWCREVAMAAPEVAFYFYDIPSLTGVAFPMAEFLEQAASTIPNLVGIKYTNADLMMLQRMLRVEGGRFDILYGMDEQLLAAAVLGVRGAVGSGYNFAAPIYNRLLAAVEHNDYAQARHEQYQGVELVATLSKYGYLAAAKELMRLRGLDLGTVRLPLMPLSAAEKAAFEQEISQLGFFEKIGAAGTLQG
ncbi:MAG: dihydrodipicolinate synthase family protein [Gemmataceae bacterium]|nr:dihydrodipicolinate synthase family protein [Gemmata sp.]MDW8196034.1 dihydrodipicolinate synthase family protein [Gemmataceae bacterium]